MRKWGRFNLENENKDFHAPPELFQQTWQQVVDELNGESERACAIVGGVFLDDLLENLLGIYLVDNRDARNDLLGSERLTTPLGNFGARVLAAYAIGLIDANHYKALKKVQKIRNRFAHDLSLNFEEPLISKLCKELSQLCDTRRNTERTPREIFQDSVAFLGGTLDCLLYVVKTFEIKGTFKKVFKLASDQVKYKKKIE